MSPRFLAISAAFIVLLAISVTPKLFGGASEAHADEASLAAAISARLRTVGFAVNMASTRHIVIASRGSCRLEARDGDYGNVMRTVFRRDAASYGNMSYGYRGRWTVDPAGARSLVERGFQNGLASIGVRIKRPAVIALAMAGDCSAVRRQLDGLYVYAKRSG